MSLLWRDNGLRGGLRDILAKSQHLDDDVYDGADVVLQRSRELAPKESSNLVRSSRVLRDRGGKNAVGIVYTSVYARYQHEHLHFKHPSGGQAKFLEIALLEKGPEAVNKAGEHFWGRL
jgi:hypothetical protein